MVWLFAALVSGNIATSSFSNEAECLGHKDIAQRDHNIYGQCIKLNETNTFIGGTSGFLNIVPGSNSITNTW